MADIKAIRERLEKATTGPWSQDLSYIVGQIPTGRPGGEVIGEMRATRYVSEDSNYPKSQREANADFTAHARQDIPDLLDLLLKYGRCKPECATWQTEMNSPGIVGRYLNTALCDCGWQVTAESIKKGNLVK